MKKPIMTIAIGAMLLSLMTSCAIIDGPLKDGPATKEYYRFHDEVYIKAKQDPKKLKMEIISMERDIYQDSIDLCQLSKEIESLKALKKADSTGFLKDMLIARQIRKRCRDSRAICTMNAYDTQQIHYVKLRFKELNEIYLSREQELERQLSEKERLMNEELKRESEERQKKISKVS